MLGGFEDSFHASLDYWTPTDYRRSWREAIQHVVTDRTPSTLVTSMADPAGASFIRWWPIYPIGQEVRIHEHLLVLDQLAMPLDPTNLFASLPAYRSHSDQGDPISEWQLPIESLATFMANPPEHP